VAPSDPTDAELMRLARAGQRDAFARIVGRYQQHLVNLFRRLGAETHGAEDCAQETFLRLYRSLDRYSPMAPFPAYLFTIARHAWIDSRRRSARHEHDEEPVEALEAPAPAGSPTDDRMDLRAALAVLPAHLRVVVVLTVDEGLSYPETAAVLGIPVGTVKSRMFHAVRALREALHAGTER
jgi:RNA polymerase sigma-70 factor (ECF subfamily)